MSAWNPVNTAPHGEIDIKLTCGSILRGAILQSDGDFWWRGYGLGELFVDACNVTGWREPNKGPDQEEGEVRWMIEDDGDLWSQTFECRRDAVNNQALIDDYLSDQSRVVRVRIVKEEE